MKNPIKQLVRKIKTFFQPKIKPVEAIKELPVQRIPRHEPVKYHHNPPCSGIAKDAAKKRKAKIRIQKESRKENRS